MTVHVGNPKKSPKSKVSEFNKFTGYKTNIQKNQLCFYMNMWTPKCKI